MADEATKLAENILRGVSGAVTSIAPLVPPAWRIALSAIGATSELIAGLISAGVNHVEAIETMRSALPDYRAAKSRLEQLIAERSKR